MSIKPFINNESRINSPIALLGSSASYSERTEFPRSLQTEINEERDGATATTYHKRPHDSTSSPTPNSDHEFSTESGYTVSKKGLKSKRITEFCRYSQFSKTCNRKNSGLLLHWSRSIVLATTLPNKEGSWVFKVLLQRFCKTLTVL